jgi:hypothetical protein
MCHVAFVSHVDHSLKSLKSFFVVIKMIFHDSSQKLGFNVLVILSDILFEVFLCFVIVLQVDAANCNVEKSLFHLFDSHRLP